MLDTPPMTSTPGGKPGMFNLCKLPTLPPPALVAGSHDILRDPLAVDLLSSISPVMRCVWIVLNPGGVVVANSGAFPPSTTRRYFLTGAEDKLVSSATADLAQIRCSDDFTPDFVSTSFFSARIFV